jgi:SulP family sulfate permease
MDFIGNKIKGFFSDMNPWPRIRIMGNNIAQDTLAGVTVAFIALPLALGFGVASGLGAITGMWGAIAGGFVGGLFGGSNVGVSGPTGPKTVQLAVVMHDHMLANGQPDLSFAFGCVFLSGVIMLILAAMGVGKFIYLTPYSVISGFMCGIGAIVIIIELNPFLGLSTLSSVREALLSIPSSIMNAHLDALMISLLTLGTILIWPKITKVIWLPAPLIGLAVGTTVANLLGLDIDYIPEVPTGLPDLYLPPISQAYDMLPPAAALAGLAIYDSLLTCVVIDQMSNDERHNSDQEIWGQGLANMAAGLIGGLTTATATMRSIANIQCGARTILSTIVCLAAILFKVGYDILDFRVFPILHRIPTPAKITFWTVFLLTVWEDLLVAVGVGLAIAFFLFVRDMSEMWKPQVMGLEESQKPGHERVPKHLRKLIAVLEPNGPMFFGIADTLYRQVDKLTDYQALIISLIHVPMVDLSGAFALEDMANHAQKNGTKVLIIGMNPGVRRTLNELSVVANIGEENFVENFEAALDEGIDYIGEQFLGRDIGPKSA